MPQTRGCEQPFRPSLLESGSRAERSLKAAIAGMYLQGVSTRRVTKVMEDLCGMEVSATQASRLTAGLAGEFEKWRNRPLPGISYLILDGTYVKVRMDGAERDRTVPTAIGVCRETGKRMALGVSTAVSEAEIHWRGFLKSPRGRGIGMPDMVTSDAHEGLRVSLRATISPAPGSAAGSACEPPTPPKRPTAKSSAAHTCPGSSPTRPPSWA